MTEVLLTRQNGAPRSDVLVAFVYGRRPSPLPSGFLPDPADLPDGSTLQVIDGRWAVETGSGWQAIAAEGLTHPMPAAAALPDGTMLMAVDGAWAAVTSTGRVAVGQYQSTGLPDPSNFVSGATLQAVSGVWEICE